MIWPIRGCRSTTLFPALGHYKLFGINHPLAHACRLAFPLGYNVGPFEAVVRQLLCWRWAITSLSPTYMLRMIGPIRGCRSTALCWRWAITSGPIRGCRLVASLQALGHHKLITSVYAVNDLAHPRLSLDSSLPALGHYKLIASVYAVNDWAHPRLSLRSSFAGIGPLQAHQNQFCMSSIGPCLPIDISTWL
jgi:hypothetical protein